MHVNIGVKQQISTNITPLEAHYSSVLEMKESELAN